MDLVFFSYYYLSAIVFQSLGRFIAEKLDCHYVVIGKLIENAGGRIFKSFAYKHFCVALILIIIEEIAFISEIFHTIANLVVIFSYFCCLFY
jgi:hypothetical protein